MTILAFDKYWQYPAITELHAYKQLQSRLNTTLSGVVYLAFPWATLFDLKDRNRESPVLQELLAELAVLAKCINFGARVVTVCQHIRLMRHQAFLIDAGVTDVYWSHATVDSENLKLNILPFPLYPVHEAVAMPVIQRKWLASFVGAKDNQYYLTQSRTFLSNVFAEESACYVRLNEAWQFNTMVYEQQVLQMQFSENLPKYQDEAYLQVLADSLFALCPAGTGPNSIRLWEAIAAGVIPVILADNYLPPGNLALWQQACVFCKEQPKAIAALPELLRELAADTALVALKLAALKQLQFLYGKDNFISDLEAFLWQLEAEYQLALPLQNMANSVLTQGCIKTKTTLALSMKSYKLLNKAPMMENFVDRVLQGALVTSASPGNCNEQQN